MPPLFAFLQQAASGLEVEELYRTLNMGVGMVVVCRPDDVATVQGAIDEETWVIGELIPDDRRVSLV
jgi:phosphoribosylaminoimidazole (AIR) synthetase